jgi:pimeloyl-ACP methyl ester carboxylesterase
VRAKLFHLLKLEDLVSCDTEIPFEAQVLSSEEKDGYTRTELALNSTVGRRLKAVVTVPVESAAPVPAVVCIHGHGGNRYVVHDDESIYKGFAAALAANGFATIATDVGQHEVYEGGRTLMGERLWDVRRSVDYAVSLPEVDGSRIGCAGLSLGGEMAMWLGAMDERIAATVSSGFLTFMDQMEQNHCLCWKFDGLRELVDYSDLYSLIAPRPLLCQNGLQEGPTQFYVPLARQAMEQIQVIYRDFGQPTLASLDVHDGAHEINLPTLLAFFDRHL